MEVTKENLSERSLDATKWNYLGTAGRIIAQTVATILLARMLGPEAFGVFAVIIMVTGIGSILIDMGLGNALTQKSALLEGQPEALFTRLLIMSALFSGAVWTSAGLIAIWFENPQLVVAIKASTLYLLLFGAGIVPTSLLKRELKMREVQIAHFSSYFIGFLVVGLGCALLDFGAISLVVALIVQSAIATFLVFFFSGFKPLFNFKADIVPLRQFGRKVLLNNLSNWTTENMDNFLIGKLFSMNALGIYAVSYNLLRTPTNHLVVTLQSVLFSTAARCQEEKERMRKPYVAVLGLVALISFPLFFGAATVAETVIAGLYGDKWSEAVAIFVPLALAMPFHALMAVTGPVISGVGEIQRELTVQLWMALFFLSAILLAAAVSFEAVAWAVFVTYLLRFCWMAQQANRVLDTDWSAIISSLKSGIVVSLAVVFSLSLAEIFGRGLELNSPIQLLADLAVASAALFIAIGLTKNWLFSGEVCWLLDKLRARIPGPLRWLEKMIFPLSYSGT